MTAQIADYLSTAIVCSISYWIGYMVKRSEARQEIASGVTANRELSERLSTITGQLADARARLDLRIKRAHDGACKGALTRSAKRIELPPVKVEWNGTEPVKVAPEAGKDGTP